MAGKESTKWFSFDPTIHAGHVINALAMIVGCTIIYCGVVNDIHNLQTENTNRKLEIAELKQSTENQKKETDAKLDNLVEVQRQEVGKLRDDMKEWFISLDQKLDRKADKK